MRTESYIPSTDPRLPVLGSKAIPVANENLGTSSIFGQVLAETQATPQASQDIQSEQEEPELPPLPELSEKARDRFEKLLADIAERPDWADQWMNMFIADSQGSPLFTLSCNPPRFVESGEIYTEEKQEYLFRIAAPYQEGRKKLYETELAKGTPMLEIVEKVFRYNCTLPEDFRKMTGW